MEASQGVNQLGKKEKSDSEKKTGLENLQSAAAASVDGLPTEPAAGKVKSYAP